MRRLFVIGVVLWLLLLTNSAQADGLFSNNTSNSPQTAYVGGSDAVYSLSITNLDTRTLYVVHPYCNYPYTGYALKAIYCGPTSGRDQCFELAPGATWTGPWWKIHAYSVPSGTSWQMPIYWGCYVQTFPGLSSSSSTTVQQTDILTVTIVPEPSSVITLLCGIGGLGGVIWRKKMG